MKYKVRVSELRYGEVEVEAASEREAKNKATRAGFNFFDSEITDITAEKVMSSDPMSVIERLERWQRVTLATTALPVMTQYFRRQSCCARRIWMRTALGRTLSPSFARTASARLRCSGTLTQTALRHSALTVASV